MIVFREKEFTAAIEVVLRALKETATDGNGLRIALRLDPEKFAAAVLATAGMQSHGEIPYLLGEGEKFPIKAFRPGDLTGFMRKSSEALDFEG